MKTVMVSVKLLFVALIVVAFCVPAFAAQPPKPIPGQYIVLMKEDKIPPAIKGQAAGADREAKVKAIKLRSNDVATKIKQHLSKSSIKESSVLAVYSNVVSGYSAKLSANEVTKLKQDSDVAGVFQDFEVNLDPMPVSTVTPTDFTAQSYVSCAVGRAGGPVNSTGKATWIWILDTGINGTHPDLNVRVDHAASFIAGQPWEDGHGHGTHCAGIAAAKMNTIGPTGVSAGAWVVPVKVLSNSGSGSFSSIVSGLNFVAAHDIAGDVVSMSIGCYPVTNCVASSPVVNQAIYNLAQYGTWVVMAAGNDGQCNGAASNLPGCINKAWVQPTPGSAYQWVPMPRAVTVGALNCDMTRAPYSNYGPGVVDWVAVGTAVYSTYKAGSYATLSGTSMATPVVAGIIHARGGAPVNGGNVNVAGCGVYPSAHR